jgi:hypothetical protein
MLGVLPLEDEKPTAITERGDTKTMIDLIENIAKAIVDKPDQVRVKERIQSLLNCVLRKRTSAK